MDTSKIAYFILNPQSLASEDVETIKTVKNKYPYCSTLHMLYVKALANSNSIDFEEQLKKSAIHVNDRAKLHELINGIQSETTTQQVDTKPTTIEAEKIDIKIENSVIENNNLKTPEVNIVDEKIAGKNEIKPIEQLKVEPQKTEPKPIKKEIQLKPTAETKKDGKVDMAKIIEDIRLKAEAARLKKENILPVETKPEDKIIDVTEDNKSEKTESEHKLTESEPLHKQIEEEETTPEKETDSVLKITSENKEIENDPLKIDVLSHAMETAFELDVDNIIRDSVSEEHDKKQKIEIKEEEKIEVDKNPDELSFTEWLKYKQGKLKVKSDKNDSQKEKVKLSKAEIDNLLNKFIEEEPKMSRPQKEFFNPVKNAKKSLDESNVLVSETLAKIYWMQKNYDKAIKAYEQLSLRNPEKKSFFANQIKKIKQELNKI